MSIDPKHAAGAKPSVYPNKYKERTPGTVTQIGQLNPGQPENKKFSQIELGLDGIQFSAGDVCGVIPVNDPKEVDRLLQLLKIDASQKVKFAGEEITAGEMFKHKVEIARATGAFLSTLYDKGKLGKIHVKDIEYIERALTNMEMHKELEANTLADIIQYLGVEGLTPEDFTNTLKPRLYTASSSPKANPDTVHMTFAVVNYDATLGNKKINKYGVTTGYMDKLSPGDKVTFFMQAKPDFRLPEEMDKPTILIGPGTGIAPFRAFVQEIEAKDKKHGDVVLYSGGQYEMDALYKGEMEKAHEKGILTQPPHYAISRSGNKQRVQGLLKRDESAIREFVDKGAVFYICGGKKMGEEVIQTLKQIAPKLDEKKQLKMDVY